MREHPARQHLERLIARAQSPLLQHTYTALHADEARLQLEHALSRPATAAASGPLQGHVVAVKDLFDLAGQVTRAGSGLFGSQGLKHAPARCDAEAVKRLKAAGAIVLGRTNMSEFAFSGVGINPHDGTPRNPCDLKIARIPGGSSSGSAVAVAAHAADVGLGTDTGGSLRIPAALCGIVGFKPTAASVPADGCFPLSRSLDSIGAMTRSVTQAAIAHGVLSAAPVDLGTAQPLRGYRLGITTSYFTENMDSTVRQAWTQTLLRLKSAGAQLVDWDSPLPAQAAALQSGASLVTIEAYELHQAWLAQHAEHYDPRVLARIALGQVPAERAAAVRSARGNWIQTMAQALNEFDAILSPTVPIVAPPLADLAPGAARDDAFFAANALLLRNTSVINFLDGCAISIPCHRPVDLPVGLMIWHGAGHDHDVLRIASRIEEVLDAPQTQPIETRA